MAKKKAVAKKGLSAAQKVGLGVGLTAAVTAAVGGYFLYGSKNAKQNRKAVKSWMLKAKAEVLEGVEKAKKMRKEEYEELVDDVMHAYGRARKLSAKEVADYKKELRGYWKDIEKEATKGTKRAVKVARKAAKKAVKTAKKKRK